MTIVDQDKIEKKLRRLSNIRRPSISAVKKAIDYAVSRIQKKSGMPKIVCDGYLEMMARRNPALIKAFLNRKPDTSKWDEILDALAADLKRDTRRADIRRAVESARRK